MLSVRTEREEERGGGRGGKSKKASFPFRKKRCSINPTFQLASFEVCSPPRRWVRISPRACDPSVDGGKKKTEEAGERNRETNQVRRAIGFFCFHQSSSNGRRRRFSHQRFFLYLSLSISLTILPCAVRPRQRPSGCPLHECERITKRSESREGERNKKR